MKKMKKLEGGFTLVELIVVMAMMVIVFGALMQVVTPTNIFFNESEAFKDEIMLSQGITDAVGDEIRYSTNVLVLENYVGVPALTADNQFLALENVEFDSALLLDNDHIRGQCFFDYDAEATSGRRKGAKGEIVRFNLTGYGVDFLDCDLIYGEDYYGDYEYSFEAFGNVDENGLGYVDFRTHMSDYITENGIYVYGEDPYDSSEFLYLKNVNLKDDDGYNIYVYDFSSSVDDTDYADFPRANADASLTGFQQSYYNKTSADNAHTWIFYYKGKPISTAENVNMIFDPGEGGNAPKSVSVRKGRPSNVNAPSFPESGFESFEINGVVFARRFKSWLCVSDQQEYSDDELKLFVCLNDETFIAQYESVDATWDVEFYDTLGNLIYSESVKHGEAVSHIPNSSINVGSYDGFVWKKKGSDKDLIDGSELTNVTAPLSLEPYLYQNLKVRYFGEDGLMIGSYTQDVMSGFGVTPQPVPDKAGHTGKWVTMNVMGQMVEPNFSEIYTNLDVFAEYEEVVSVGVSDVSFSLGGDGVWNPYYLQHNPIGITNLTGGPLHGTVTIKIKYNCAVSVKNQAASWHNWIDSVTTTYMGDTVTITVKIKNSTNSWELFNNGDKMDIQQLMVNVPSATAKVESVTVEVT